MQANSRGAARYIPAWVMWVQIIWKVLFPKELLQTAFSAGIMDQIKALSCVPNPLPGCVFISCWHDRCGVGLSHLHPREEQSQLAEDHCNHRLGIHSCCQPPTKNASILGGVNGLGCASSAGCQEAELGTGIEGSAPLQQRRTDKQLLETMMKYFKKREKLVQGREG